jgi:hypothetical protein
MLCYLAVNRPGIAMKKFIAFALASALLFIGMVATAAPAGEWVTCKDGLKVQNKVTCGLHGGVVIEANKSTPIKSQPIDASKRPVSKQTMATTKDTTKNRSASSRKQVAARSSSPTAKCNDGALYYLRERRGACASHGGVNKWFGW